MGLFGFGGREQPPAHATMRELQAAERAAADEEAAKARALAERLKAQESRTKEVPRLSLEKPARDVAALARTFLDGLGNGFENESKNMAKTIDAADRVRAAISLVKNAPGKELGKLAREAAESTRLLRAVGAGPFAKTLLRAAREFDSADSHRAAIVGAGKTVALELAKGRSPAEAVAIAKVAELVRVGQAVPAHLAHERDRHGPSVPNRGRGPRTPDAREREGREPPGPQ